MFTLQRTDDLFEIHKEASGFGDVARQMSPASPMTTCRPTSACHPRYAQWKRFVEGGEPKGLPLDDVLLDSWRRCREMDVDPSPRKCWSFTPASQLEPFAEQLREYARDIEARTYKAIRGQNLLITMTDSKARVVRTCGDRETLCMAEKLNFGPGASWAEESVGTNAIGTALYAGQPLQVFGGEHYCRSHQAWNCAAAPIFDPHGRPWGCFDISGPASSDFSRTLPLVLYAAREIERRLFNAYLADIELTSYAMVSAVFNGMSTGMLTVDDQDRILHANPAAEALLGQAGRALRGRRVDAFLNYAPFRARRKEDPACRESMVLRCRTNPDLMVRATPMRAFSGVSNHTMVTLTEARILCVAHPVQAAHPVRAAEPPSGSQANRFGDVFYRDPAMSRAVLRARQAALTPSTVVLFGETGTGKELFARGIHGASSRAGGPFVAVNCGALPRELVQSELFGYQGGAFTGAMNKGRAGKFEQADKGTLFLDEISEMPLDMQVNLLRPLEDRAVTRVGGSQARPVDVKVIAATNRDLSELVAQGAFREDLYYRINVVNIVIPPLRERPGDVLLLAEHHARALCRRFGLTFSGFDPQALDILCAYPWPGNVRELFNCVEYAVNVMEGGRIRPGHLPSVLVGGAAARAPELPAGSAVPAGERAVKVSCRLENVVAETIREALSRHGGNVSHAAKALGIGRNTLYAKMRKCGLS